MTKSEISRRMARESGVSPGEAADRLDRVIQEILRSLRRGKSAPLPGLGKFNLEPGGQVGFERDPHQRNRNGR